MNRQRILSDATIPNRSTTRYYQYFSALMTPSHVELKHRILQETTVLYHRLHKTLDSTKPTQAIQLPPIFMIRQNTISVITRLEVIII